MISWDEYKKIPEREWLGKKLVTIQPLSNYYATVAEGTVVTVVRKMSGFGIKTAACPRCKVVLHMSKVSPTYLRRPEPGELERI